MNIGIQLDRQDFLYDIHSLVKSFFPEDEVSVYTDADTDKCGIKRDLLFRVEIPSYEDRKAAKDALKRELYGTLSDLTGIRLPWGTLSGIRPTKIPMGMLEKGRSDEEIRAFLMENYFVTPEKCGLALQIAKTERELLKGIDLSEDSWSLYFHVPFCPSICLYCTFSSSPYGAWKKRAGEYIATMLGEYRRFLEESGTGRPPSTIYIGGGTPTSLTAEELERLLSGIEELTDTRAALEYTVEAGRPDSITPEKLRVLKAHGVTRISVNPQSMNPETLELIGRAHTPEDTVRAFYLAREAGFDDINMDIILGLPGEGAAEVSRTLDAVRELKPDSLTVHSLAVKRASRLRQTIREDREKDAGADYGNFQGRIFENSREIMALAADCAKDLGMEPYYLYRQKNMKGNLENTGFARPGKACLYNILIMEEVQAIRAFGAGGSTKTVSPDGRIERVISPKDVKTYLERQAQRTGTVS